MASTAPAVDARGVFRLAVPIILANLSLPLVGAVDTAILGHLDSPHHLAGLGIATVVFSTVFWLLGFIRMGTTGFTAQALGADDKAALGAAFARAVMLSLGMAVVLIAFQGPLGGAAFSLLEGSPAAMAAGEAYFHIRIWAAPATLINLVVVGWLIGLQHTRDALVIQLCLNGLNAGLDVLFVTGFGWGIAGVAVGTAIAEYAAAGLGIWIVLRRMHAYGAVIHWHDLWDQTGVARLFAVNGDIFIRTFFLVIAFGLITREGGRLGDYVLAANAILLNLQAFVSFGLDGFAQAAETLVGRAYGARNRAAVRRAVVVSTWWAGGLSLTYALVFLGAGPALISLYTGFEGVQDVALAHLPWLIASPIISVWCFQLDGVFIGAQRTRDMRNMMVIAFAAFVAALYGLLPVWGTHALWAALIVFFVVRGVTLAACYPALERSIKTI